MKLNDSGYITEISTTEAVALLNSVLFSHEPARQNGKSRTVTNYLIAWNNIMTDVANRYTVYAPRYIGKSGAAYIYQCTACNKHFEVLDEHGNYCPNCGVLLKENKK